MRLEALNSFPALETERLWLKELRTSDIFDFFDIFSRENVMELYGMFPINELDDAQWFIERFNDSLKNKRAIRWGIYDKKHNRLIGTCGFHSFNELASRAEMGYELHEDYWRKGIMNEALNAIIKWGFNIFELNRIEALIYPSNLASEMLILKCGFTKEGLLRQYAFFREVYQDLNIFSLLKQEWRYNENINSRG